MCANVERLDFVLDKKKAEECALRTYDLFSLSRPRKIVWCVDILDEVFARSARNARSVGSARSALSAGSARSAWSALSVGSAGSAFGEWSAGSARGARSAGSARSVRSAWSALDYDFDWFVIENEYCSNREDNPGDEPDENDKKYLEYSELLMQAKEYGLGYWVELEDTLYLVPTPLVRIDSMNRYHSDELPAIRWKNGMEVYFLHGVKFEKELWEKVVSRKMPFADILAIEDIDQRRQAIKYGDWNEFVKYQNAQKIDEFVKFDVQGRMVNYELWKFPYQENEDKRIFSKEVYFTRYLCPSVREWHISGVPEFKTCAEAMAWKMSNDQFSISPEEWKELKPLFNEA